MSKSILTQSCTADPSSNFLAVGSSILTVCLCERHSGKGSEWKFDTLASRRILSFSDQFCQLETGATSSGVLLLLQRRNRRTQWERERESGTKVLKRKGHEFKAPRYDLRARDRNQMGSSNFIALQGRTAILSPLPPLALISFSSFCKCEREILIFSWSYRWPKVRRDIYYVEVWWSDIC